MITRDKKEEIAEAIDLRIKNGPKRVSTEYSDDMLELLEGNYDRPEELAYACYYYGIRIGVINTLRASSRRSEWS